MTASNVPSRRLYWIGVLVMVGSIGLALGIGLPKIMAKVREFPRAVMPGTQELTLAAGEHTLFYELQSVVDGKVYAGDPPSGLRCAMASVEDNAALVVTATSGSTKYTMGSYEGVSMASVTTPKAGRYRLSCEASSERPFVIAFGQGMMGAILWTAIPAVVGVLAGLAYIIILRRKRKRALAAAPTA